MADQSSTQQIVEAALECEKATGIPAEVTAAQCILESGWLQHAPQNNCFGIKSYPGCFGLQLLKTDEWFTEVERVHFLGGKAGRSTILASGPNAAGRCLYECRDWFATFPTLADCFTEHSQLLLIGRYLDPLRVYREDGNIEAYVRAIAPIYATDPKYADKIMNIIQSTNLKREFTKQRDRTTTGETPDKQVS